MVAFAFCFLASACGAQKGPGPVGETGVTGSFSNEPKPLEAVTGLKIVQATATTIKIAWDPVPSGTYVRVIYSLVPGIAAAATQTVETLPDTSSLNLSVDASGIASSAELAYTTPCVPVYFAVAPFRYPVGSSTPEFGPASAEVSAVGTFGASSCWTEKRPNASFTSVAANPSGSILLASEASQKLWISTNQGTTWSLLTSARGSRVIFYENSFHILEGFTSLRSSDGYTWTKSIDPPSASGFGVVYELGGKLYSVSSTAWFVRSSTGQWVSLPTGSYAPPMSNGSQVLYTTGTGLSAFRSTDGVTFSGITLGAGMNTDCTAVFRLVAAGTRFYVNLGGTGTCTNGRLLTSVDGLSWAPITLPPSANLGPGTFFNGRFVLTGYDVLLTSTDGTTFTEIAGTRTGNRYDGAITAGSRVFAWGDAGLNVTSNDGVTAAIQHTDAEWRSGATDGSRVVLVGTAGGIATSADSGVTFNVSSAGINTRFRHVARVATDKFVAAGDDGALFLSTDGGVNWVDRSNAAFGGLSAVFSKDSGNTIIAVSVGQVALSTNGGASFALQAAASAPYCVTPIQTDTTFHCGTGTALAKSTDGINWQGVTGTQGWVTMYAQKGGVLVGGTANGFASSVDGQSWVLRTLPQIAGVPMVLFSVAVKGTEFWGIGWNGIAISADGATWTAHPTGSLAVGCTVSVAAGSNVVCANNVNGIFTLLP